MVVQTKLSKKELQKQNYRRQKEAEEIKEALLKKQKEDAEREQKKLEKKLEERKKVEKLAQQNLLQQAELLLKDSCKKPKPVKAEEHVDVVNDNQSSRIENAAESSAFNDDIWDSDGVWDEAPRTRTVSMSSDPRSIVDHRQNLSGALANRRQQNRSTRAYSKENEQYSAKHGNKAQGQRRPREVYRPKSKYQSGNRASESSLELSYDQNKTTNYSRRNKDVVDAPLPDVNVWEKRQAQKDFIQEISPHTELEEEAMLFQAMELSRKQVSEDEKHRRTYQELYDCYGDQDSQYSCSDDGGGGGDVGNNHLQYSAGDEAVWDDVPPDCNENRKSFKADESQKTVDDEEGDYDGHDNDNYENNFQYSPGDEAVWDAQPQNGDENLKSPGKSQESYEHEEGDYDGHGGGDHGNVQHSPGDEAIWDDLPSSSGIKSLSYEKSTSVSHSGSRSKHQQRESNDENHIHHKTPLSQSAGRNVYTPQQHNANHVNGARPKYVPRKQRGQTGAKIPSVNNPLPESASQQLSWGSHRKDVDHGDGIKTSVSYESSHDAEDELYSTRSARSRPALPTQETDGTWRNVEKSYRTANDDSIHESLIVNTSACSVNISDRDSNSIECSKRVGHHATFSGRSPVGNESSIAQSKGPFHTNVVGTTEGTEPEIGDAGLGNVKQASRNKLQFSHAARDVEERIIVEPVPKDLSTGSFAAVTSENLSTLPAADDCVETVKEWLATSGRHFNIGVKNTPDISSPGHQEEASTSCTSTAERKTLQNQHCSSYISAEPPVSCAQQPMVTGNNNPVQDHNLPQVQHDQLHMGAGESLHAEGNVLEPSVCLPTNTAPGTSFSPQHYSYGGQPVMPPPVALDPFVMQQLLAYSHPFFAQQLQMLQAYYSSLAAAQVSGYNAGMLAANALVQVPSSTEVAEAPQASQSDYSPCCGIQSEPVNVAGGISSEYFPPPVSENQNARETTGSHCPPGFQNHYYFANNGQCSSGRSQPTGSENDAAAIPPPVPRHKNPKKDVVRQPRRKFTDFYPDRSMK